MEEIQTGRALTAYGMEHASCARYGEGHINDTFLVVQGEDKRILQRLNRHVFPHPLEVMENVSAVLAHLKARITDPRGTLTLLPTVAGADCFVDSDGEVFRMYDFVRDSASPQKAESPAQFGLAGEAFGRFCGLLADFPAERLHEVIPAFHDTEQRYAALLRAAETDPLHRAAEVAAEIGFYRARAEVYGTLRRAREAGVLPLRVTHNDTKLNNVLFDARTGAPLCVIDLDTVMPGFSVTDFGDAIRFGANTGAEDERDLSLVSFSLPCYRAYAEGFLRGSDGRLTEGEVRLFPEGALLMTLECGMRFLTDYLMGDTYFRIHRPGHNLDRCRTQIKLAKEMEEHLEQCRNMI